MQKWWAIAGFGFLAAAMMAVALFLSPDEPSQSPQIILADKVYEVTIMRSEDERQRGLSGTDSLPNGRAMLFVLPPDNAGGIWMKDMNYAIDIVWLDDAATVVHLVENAQPSSYPDTTFYPPTMSRYVIELPSGTIKQTAIKKGMRATLPSGV